MKSDFEFACDQLNSTNHSLLLELSSSASCQHILTMCIRSCTYMDTLPLIPFFLVEIGRFFQILPSESKKGLRICRAVK